MLPSRFLPFLRASLMVSALATGPAAIAQQATADRDDAALAYAQCMRDNGYSEFPDPTPDGGLRFLINPESAPRFQAAAAACHHLAPEGFRDETISPDDLDALLRLSQCMRENGLPDFPDPDSDGRYDLRSAGLGPGDARLDAGMAICRDAAGLGQGGRIVIGG